MTWTDGIILFVVMGIVIGMIVSRLLQPKGCQCRQVKHLAKLKAYYENSKKNEGESTPRTHS